MSKEALVGFLNAMTEDQGLQDELREAAEGTGDEAAIPTERLVQIAGARGFEFSAEEVLGIGELSDDELEAVAGGAAFAKYDGVLSSFKAGLPTVQDKVMKSVPLGFFNSFFDVFNKKWI
jgi:predicted ribosomally synthesized peptide with nif11-like leader